MAVTSGQGVDVVLNFLTGDLLHDSWRACAEFGRFVEIGKRDIIDGGRLDMDVFDRGVTFTAFDLSSLYYTRSERQNSLWNKYVFLSLRSFKYSCDEQAPMSGHRSLQKRPNLRYTIPKVILCFGYCASISKLCSELEDRQDRCIFRRSGRTNQGKETRSI